MSWDGNCRNISQMQLAFRKPIAKGKFSSNPLRKKNLIPPPQDKMLSIPNCCRNVNKMTMKYQNPPVTIDILTSQQTIQTGEGLKAKEPPTVSVAAASIMDSLQMPWGGGENIKGNKA